MSLNIKIHGTDKSFWQVHGKGQGTEGVILSAEQVKGLFAAPVRTEWKATARGVGGRPKGRWFEWRDLSLGFHVAEQFVEDGDQEDIMSRFRQAFDYREDDWDPDARLAMIEVSTDTSTRFLDVQLYEEPDFDPGIDPLVTGYGNPILPLRAGQPFWYEQPHITHWSTDSTSGSGTVLVSNPTDQVMYQKWIITRGKWTLPDLSWTGPRRGRVPGPSKLTGRDDSERTILMPEITALHGGGVVDLDPMELMVRDAHGTNLLGQMPIPGMFFEYPIPPWTTTPIPLPVTVTDAPASGAMVQLVQPRLWSEAIGGQ